MKRQLAPTLIMSFLLCACTQSVAVTDEASQTKAAADGVFNLGTESVKLNFAYAHKIKSVAGDKDYDIIVLLTDKPIPVELTSENIESPGFIIQEHKLRCLQLEFTRNNLFLGRDPSRKDWGFHYGKAHLAGRGIMFGKTGFSKSEEEGIKLEQEGNVVTGTAKATGVSGGEMGELSFSVGFRALLKGR